MIKEFNRTFIKVNDALGGSIKIPEPRKGILKATAALNCVVGAGFAVAGIVFSSKWCIIIGGLAIVSSVIQGHESKSAIP